MKKLMFALLLGCSMPLMAQYTGTGAVTQGAATATTGNLYTCTGGRIARQGTITATNNTVWTVPAEVNFTNTAFPTASNLYNPCTGATYANASAALAALNGSDIVTIDADIRFGMDRLSQSNDRQDFGTRGKDFHQLPIV